MQTQRGRRVGPPDGFPGGFAPPGSIGTSSRGEEARLVSLTFPVGFFLLLTLHLLFPSAAAARQWTNSTGKEHLEAELVDGDEERVWLKPPGDPTFSIPLASLSKADQDYVRSFLRDEKAARKIRPETPGDVHYGPARQFCALACPRLDELSGMACSRRRPGLFWAHCDSGDEARVYLFDLKGRDLGSCLLSGVRNYDWEDMASFTADGKPYLLLADTGNNGLAAAVHMLYLIEEPPCDPDRGLAVKEVSVLRTIYFSFEDDYRNCEAMAIDPTDKTILLVSKERAPTCYAYALPWPKDDHGVNPGKPPKRALVAKRIGVLNLRQVTGMDVSPDGRRAIVVTYGNAFEYTRGEKDDWAKAFAQPPREIALPKRAQGESICYGPDGKILYASSEQRPTPLVEVPARPVP